MTILSRSNSKIAQRARAAKATTKAANHDHDIDHMEPLKQPANVEVTNPAHYGSTDFIEPLDVIHGVPFGFGISYKHLARLGLKGGDNTPTRDSKAAVWYTMDTLVRAVLEDDSDHVPSVEEIAAWDSKRFYVDLFAYAREQEALLGSMFAERGIKRAVLASISKIETRERAMRFTGISECDYRAHLLEVIAVARLIIHYAGSVVKEERRDETNAEPFTLYDIYKGTKSNRLEIDDDVYVAINAYFTLLDGRGLLNHAYFTLGWDDRLILLEAEEAAAA